MSWMATTTMFIVCLLHMLPIQVFGGGHVEIEFLHYHNSESKDDKGDCCDIGCNDCENYFDICYREYNVSKDEDCTLREVTSFKFHDNVTFHSGQALGNGVSNPFTFRFPRKWLGAFSLQVTVWDSDEDHLILGRTPDQVALLTMDIHRGAIIGSAPVRATLVGSYSLLKLQWRVVCDDYYYNDCLDYCKAENSDETGHYTCDQAGNKVCNSGWTGDSCTIDASVCSSQPCHNGGVCNSTVNGFTCTCPMGFVGALCELDLSRCRSQPCQNGGTCHSTQNDYVCVCADGFRGDLCESDLSDHMRSMQENDGSDNTAIYAGASAGAVVFLFMIIVILVLLHRRHRASKHVNPVSMVVMSRINNDVDQPKMVNLGVEPIYDTIGDPENQYDVPGLTSNVNNPNYGKCSDTFVSSIEIKHENSDMNQSATEQQREEYVCMDGNKGNAASFDGPKSAAI